VVAPPGHAPTGRVVGVITRHDVLRSLTRSDAELLAAVSAVLTEAGEPDIEPHVESGVVRLEGKAQRGSSVNGIVRVVADVDHVMTVHERLGWRTDDVGLPQL
jgi:CBS domain-containing protein